VSSYVMISAIPQLLKLLLESEHCW
jgi:hypothetical protein